jgi:alpha/beta superfamily hydrolase
MRAALCLALSLAIAGLAGVGGANAAEPTLQEARKAHVTQVPQTATPRRRPDSPPGNAFRLIRYPSPAGALAAYLTPAPAQAGKHAAIIWITGGDANSIGDMWSRADRRNDQSARAFREAGLVMMVPSLRGGNDNPGHREGFYGEVDDVLAAADFLAAQPYVDPQRIYLGGHSTGGTLALLTAETSDRFRAVFAFGPVARVGPAYVTSVLPGGLTDPEELALRSPIRWLSSIRTPVFVFEGAAGPSNAGQVAEMSRVSANPLAHFYLVAGADHFSVLAPITEVIAGKLGLDVGPRSSLTFSQSELDQAFLNPGR